MNESSAMRAEMCGGHMVRVLNKTEAKESFTDHQSAYQTCPPGQI